MRVASAPCPNGPTWPRRLAPASFGSRLGKIRFPAWPPAAPSRPSRRLPRLHGLSPERRPVVKIRLSRGARRSIGRCRVGWGPAVRAPMSRQPVTTPAHVGLSTEREVLTVRQLAERSGLGVRRLRRLIVDQGELPAYSAGSPGAAPYRPRHARRCLRLRPGPGDHRIEPGRALPGADPAPLAHQGGPRGERPDPRHPADREPRGALPLRRGYVRRGPRRPRSRVAGHGAGRPRGPALGRAGGRARSLLRVAFERRCASCTPFNSSPGPARSHRRATPK
jgi:hypothetical protein